MAAFQCLYILLVVLMTMFMSSYGLNEDRQRREAETDSPIAEPENNSTMNNTVILHDSQEGNHIGLIVGITIAVIVVIAVAVALIAYRLKKQRSSDMEREAKVQMNTTKNAGVYVDLATNPEEDKDKETDKLRTTEEEA